MMKHRILTIMVALAVVWPASAEGQVRAGVPVELLTPPAMQLVDVQLSAAADQPVRLAYAAAGDTGSRVYLDVYVAPDEAGARAALERQRESVAGSFAPHAGLGDLAYGGGDLIAFCRDNVFIAIRAVRHEDLSGWARALDGLIRRSPVGRPRASATLSRLPSLSSGQAPIRFAFPGEVLEAMVLAHGAAIARRTASGWLLSTPTREPAAFEVRLVDRRLRQP